MLLKPVDITRPGVAERFWSLVEMGPGCWTWKGRHNPRSGYAVFWVAQGLTTAAHRWARAFAGRPLALDRVGDHVCRNRGCIRPDHVDEVTQRENCRRGDSGRARGEQLRSRTHCPRGHAYTVENTRVRFSGGGYAHRHCRTCERGRAR